MQVSPVKLYSIVYPEFSYYQNDKKNKSKNILNHSQKSTALSSTLQAYNGINLSFKSTRINDINFILFNEEKPPVIKVEIALNRPFETKRGIVPLYETYLRLKNPESVKNGDYLSESGFSRVLTTFMSDNNINNTLKDIDNNFVNIEMTPELLQKAKKYTLVMYDINKQGLDRQHSYYDIPANITADNYAHLIDNITAKDIIEHNKKVLSNSDINVTLFLNKDFYNAHKDKIMPLLNKTFERN